MVGISGLVADKNYREITDPDVVAELQDLKMLPDNVLMEYAQNPNDPKKQTNAIVVLQSRKIAKEKQTNSPQATVKDDIIASISEPPKVLGASASNEPASQGIGAPGPTPQQLLRAGGVARLPSNVGNYAGGGIVAFKEAGYVNEPNAIYPDYLNQPKAFQGFDPNIKVTQENIFKLKQQLAQLESEPNKRPFLISQVKEQIKAQQDYLNAPKTGGGYTPTESPIKSEQTLQENLPIGETTTNKPSLGETQGDLFNTNVESLEDMIAGEIKGPEVPTATSMTNTGTDIENLLKVNRNESDKIANDLGIDLDTLKDKRTLDDFATEVKGNYEKMGVDPKMFKAIGEDVKSQKDLLKGEIGRAADMALIEAGLLIAGGESSNALSNVAKGTPAIQNYMKNLSNLRGEEREIAKFELTIASADSAMKMGMADKALALYSKAQDNIADIEKSKLSTEAKIKLDNLTLRTQADIDQILTDAKIKAQYGLQDMRGETAVKVAEIGSAGRGVNTLLQQAKLKQDYEKMYDELKLADDDEVKNLTRKQYVDKKMAEALSNTGTLAASSTSGQLYEFDPSIYQ